MRDRALCWDGCLNARDLGGIRASNGGQTRWGRIVRSDNPAYLSVVGWSALHDYGIRTIVALRTVGRIDDEPGQQLIPSDITIRRVFLEDATDPEFAERCVGTGFWESPLYFPEMLGRWPDRCAMAVRAVARAKPGGVVIACGRGCDRTGLVAFLLLGLAGVSADEIAADWAMSVDRLRPRDPSYEQRLRDLLAAENTTNSESIAETLASVDIADRLHMGGLTDRELRAVRERLVGGPTR